MALESASPAEVKFDPPETETPEPPEEEADAENAMRALVDLLDTIPAASDPGLDEAIPEADDNSSDAEDDQNLASYVPFEHANVTEIEVLHQDVEGSDNGHVDEEPVPMAEAPSVSEDNEAATDNSQEEVTAEKTFKCAVM